MQTKEFKSCKNFLVEIKEGYSIVYSYRLCCWNERQLKRELITLDAEAFEAYGIDANPCDCETFIYEIKPYKL